MAQPLELTEYQEYVRQGSLDRDGQLQVLAAAHISVCSFS